MSKFSRSDDEHTESKASSNLFRFTEKADMVWLIPGIVLSVILSMNTLVSAILMSEVFNRLQDFLSAESTADEFNYTVKVYSAGLFALAVESWILNSLVYICMTIFGERQAQRALALYVRSVVNLDFSSLDDKKEILGELASAIKCSEDLRSATSLSLAFLIQSFATVISCLIFALVSKPVLTLITLSGLPAIALVGQLCSSYMSRFLLLNKQYFTTSSDLIHWSMQEIQTVKVFQGEKKQIDKLHRSLQSLYEMTKKIYAALHFQESTAKATSLSMFVGGLFYGISLVNKGKASVGDVIKVFWCCLAASGSLSAISSQLLYATRGMVAVQKLDVKVDMKASQLAKIKHIIGLYPQQSNGWISLSHVDFYYSTGPTTPILSDCSMTFSSGRMNFIVGGSGSGKSTLIGILLKLYPISSGQVFIDGYSIDRLSSKWLHENIAVMSQSSFIFDKSLADNILLGADRQSAGKDLKGIYADSGIDGILEMMKQGENTAIGRSGVDMSGGQKQRILFARTIISKAQILIFDEPTSALDENSKKIMMDTIRRLSKRKTVIMICHDLSILESTDHVNVLENGRVVEHGPFWELRKSRNGYLEAMMEHVDMSDSGGQNPVRETAVSISSEATLYAEEKLSKKVSVTTEIQEENSNVYLELFWMIPNKALFFLGLFSSVLAASFNPVFSYALSHLMNLILPGSMASERTKWLIIILCLIFGEAIFTFGKIFLDISSEQWLKNLRNTAFENTLGRKMAWISNIAKAKSSESSLETLLMGNLENARLLVTQFTAVISIVVTSIGTVIWCIIVGWKLSLAAVSLFPAFYIVSYLYNGLCVKWEEKYDAKSNELKLSLEDIFSGIKTIKIQGLENHFFDSLQIKQHDIMVYAKKKALILGTVFGITKSFLLITQGLLLFYGMKLVSSGEYKSSQVMTILVMILYGLVCLETMLASLPQIGNGLRAAESVIRLTEEPPPPHSHPLPNFKFKHIEFDNVSFRYTNESTPAIRNTSFIVNENEVLAITGPSGCGKSTIASLLTSLYTAQGGKILVNKQDIRDIPFYTIRSQVALCGQMPLAFFHGTIRENLLYGVPGYQEGETSDEQENDMKNICKICLIHDHITTNLEQSYDAVIGGSSDAENNQLSGGQMQRLGLARALLRKPQLLILDEATSALDAISTAAILQVIAGYKAARSMTIILITHELEVAKIADRTLYLPGCSLI